MNDWTTVWVGVGGSAIAAAAGLMGGVIVARSGERTARRQRLEAAFRPFTQFLLETSSAVSHLAKSGGASPEEWGLVSQRLPPLALAVQEALAYITIDPDVEPHLAQQISMALGAAQEATERADRIVIQGLSPQDDQDLARLTADLEMKSGIALNAMHTELAGRRNPGRNDLTS